ncbi:hypothetical protein ACWD5R_30825 [Streptomyces sp. NPDC002514]
MPQNVKAKQTDFVASLAKGLEVLHSVLGARRPVHDGVGPE